ncbi:MAG: UbiH/UbiF/VisC/COQ6 family ubiquinone biosynthesis hydroxylase [Caulobacteraceae bacterium]
MTDQALPTDIDVIIAGAGMAGATLALALHSGGLKPLLIDPQPFDAQLAPTFDGRASAIGFSAFRQWRAIGAGEALAPHAQPIEQILVTDDSTPGAAKPSHLPFYLRFDSSEIADRSEGEPLGYLVENRYIRTALAGAVIEKGIPVLAPAAVASVNITPSHAEVILRDGRTLKAPLVVGAEGRGSVVRKSAGIGDFGWGYGQSGVVATVDLAKDHKGVAYEHFLPSGPFAILPLTHQRASLVWTESTARGEALRNARDEVFHAHLQRRFGDFLGQVKAVGPRFVYPLSILFVERLYAPRVVLLGDAAHGVHPIAGQGLNLGLKDAAALSQVLHEAMTLGEDIGGEAVLQRYSRWRNVDNVGQAVVTDMLVRLFSNDNPALRLARGLGLAAVNRIGPLRRLLMHEAGGAFGDLPRLLRNQPL